MTRRTKRYKNIVSVESVINDIIPKIISENNPEFFQIRLLWEKAFEANVVRNASPEKFSRNTLYITAKNNIWKYELYYYREQIKDKLNQLLGKDLIKDIKFQ